MKIEEAIQQKKFRNEFHKAQVNLMYTAAWVMQQSNQVLKPFHLSVPQFNILRILRGMHPEPATVKLLMERMIDKMSNASRLVDKLLEKGLVDRRECPEDRRRVDISITPEGLGVLEKASLAIDQMVQHSMRSITEEEARELNRLLDQVRSEV